LLAQFATVTALRGWNDHWRGSMSFDEAFRQAILKYSLSNEDILIRAVSESLRAEAHGSDFVKELTGAITAKTKLKSPR
jgi:hypothetical protein